MVRSKKRIIMNGKENKNIGLKRVLGRSDYCQKI